MLNLNQNLKEIYAELKQRAAKLNLWETDFLDRLIIDYKSRKEMKILSVEDQSLWKSNKYTLRCEMDHRKPVKLLPNCVKYLGENNSWSWITALLDFRKRSARQGGRMIGWLNGNRNGFLRYRFRHMGRLRDEMKSREYWRNGINLMKSKVWVVSSLNHVCPGWEKKINDETLHHYLGEIHKLVNTRPVEMYYRRVYIDKDSTGSGAKRPLGVPDVSWRVYLHMWNTLIVWWTMPKLPKEQHAFQPGKGTWTAWRRLFGLLEGESNIYEFDLSNFYGNIDLDYNKERMIEMGIPESIAEYLYQVNQSIVHLDWCGSRGDELDETAHRSIIWNAGGRANPNLPAEWQEDLNSGDPARRETREGELLAQGFGMRQEKGIPQGAATSCGLSLLNVSELFERHEKLVMYADDGIQFPLHEDEVDQLDVEGAGVIKANHKSRWIKREGVWEGPLKFLGLEYIPSGVVSLSEDPAVEFPRLRAHTRGSKSSTGVGSRLEFSVREQLIAFLHSQYEGLSNDLGLVEKGMSRAEEMKKMSSEEMEGILRSRIIRGKKEMGNNPQMLRRWKKEEERLEDVLAWEKSAGKAELEIPSVLALPEGLTVGDWLNKKVEDFKSLTVYQRLRQLFSTSLGPTLMAGMYNGSWDLWSEEATEFTCSRGSWCEAHWGGYLYRLIREEKVFNILNRILEWEESTEEEKGSLRANLWELKKYPPWQQEEALWSLMEVKGVKGVKTAPQEVKANTHTLDPKWKLELQDIWKKLIDWIKLDQWNSSSQATDDLLNLLGRVRKGEDLLWIKSWSQLEEIKGYKPLKIKRTRRQKEEILEDRKETEELEEKAKMKRRKKRVKRISRELKEECQRRIIEEDYERTYYPPGGGNAKVT